MTSLTCFTLKVSLSPYLSHFLLPRFFDSPYYSLSNSFSNKHVHFQHIIHQREAIYSLFFSVFLLSKIEIASKNTSSRFCSAHNSSSSFFSAIPHIYRAGERRKAEKEGIHHQSKDEHLS